LGAPCRPGINRLLSTPTQDKPFDPVYFGAWFAEAIDKAGLPDDSVLHGLQRVDMTAVPKSDKD